MQIKLLRVICVPGSRPKERALLQEGKHFKENAKKRIYVSKTRTDLMLGLNLCWAHLLFESESSF